MEDHSGNGWNSESGVLCVVSHQDFSDPVSELIADTTRYPAPVDQIQRILAEKVYAFRTN